MDADEFIDDFLEHAFYDPVKRRIYYLKNRKLKGRKKSKGKRLTEAQEKIIAQRQRAKKLSPEKRNFLEKKLDDAQRKLNNIKKSANKNLTVENAYNKIVKKEHSLVKKKRYGATPDKDYEYEAVRTKRRFMIDTDNRDLHRVEQFKIDKMPKGPARDKRQNKLDKAVKSREERHQRALAEYRKARKREKAAEAAAKKRKGK